MAQPFWLRIYEWPDASSFIVQKNTSRNFNRTSKVYFLERVDIEDYLLRDIDAHLEASALL